MNANGAIRQTASFAPAPYGPRLRLVAEPAQGEVRGAVLLAPPFAEEMNKCRRMAARMARLLAAQGWQVVRPDLRGCGDSAGEFRDADWADWIADLQAELAALPAGLPVWLWCIRAGALLAEPLAEARPDLNLLLWQPVLNGAQHLQQFLRLHAGGRIVGAAAEGPSPLGRLRAGECVELGGYELGPALARGMERATLALPASFRGRIAWFDVQADATASPGPATQKVLESLRARALSVDHAVVAGPPFWQTVEIEECEALLQVSLAGLGTAQPARAATCPA